MKTIAQLFDGIDYAVNHVNCDSKIDYISHDSRDILPDGCPLFFAIRGTYHDGNELIDAVVATNKNTIVVSDRDHDRGIKVPELGKTMAIVVRRFYDFPDEKMNIVAVTGTNGKSSICFLLRHLLDKCGLLSTVEYDIGGEILTAPNTTPIALDFYKLLHKCRQNGCKTVASEASSHGIDQSRTFGLAIAIAIFTNLSHEHLDYHSTVENYFLAKKKLFVGENGSIPKISLVNIDDNYGLKLFEILKANGQRVRTFGFTKTADFSITNVGKSSLVGSFFTVKHGSKSYDFETKLFGDYNISNIVASISAANILGDSFEQLREKLVTFGGTPGRLDCVSLKTGALAFVDFAHTPYALEKVLSTLLKQPHRHIISVFGCGGERDRSKRAPMTTIVTKLSDFSIATADNTRREPLEEIFDDMRLGVACGKDAIEFIPDRRTAIERAVQMSREGDIVLIAGRGHENEHKIGNKIIHFNDKEVLEEINAKL
ncbi:MAG: UDP-N-acetylmuramoyl-L-alanyl-D-glutamate--2,6-diaminopimelate ligase [Puniceicoccales bacterium]|nr:UDP-N-acetylmuramoyl-L-alanyl-D-glutamate--2,6-diaminopimelate ligase [Puniceicoccales bacterium]